MKRSGVPPYHLFEHRGCYFALDPEKIVFVRLDALAYRLLQTLQSGATLGHAAATLEEDHAPADVERAVTEWLTLRSQGLMTGPVTTYDAEDYERQTARLLNMSTGNIELYLAEACNMRCKYCYVDENGALHNRLMPWEVARAAVDLVFHRAQGVPQIQITFFGGEPLMNKPVLRKVIEYSQELGKRHDKPVRYSLTTNATLMDEEIINYIKRYNFGLMISADGPPEVHDDMRPMADGTGSFERMAANVRALMRRRRQVTARCTVSNRHLNLFDIVTFLEDFGFTRVGLSTCQGKSYRLGEYDVGPEYKPEMDAELDRLLDRWIEQVNNGEALRYDPYSGVVRSFVKRDRTRAPMLHCGLCRGCTTVGVDGSLYPCHRYVGMANWVIGDVWSGVKREEHERCLREYFKAKEKCASCWAVNICGGMCVWYVSHEDGTCYPPPEWRCDAMRRWIEKTAWVFEKIAAECPEYVETIRSSYDEQRHQAYGIPTATRPSATAAVSEGDAVPQPAEKP